MKTICPICKIRKIELRSGQCKLCKQEYMREYYKNNCEKMKKQSKEWLLKSDYYENNREKIREKNREYSKKNNYKYEKTPEQRKLRGIKRKTRRLYPLKVKKCEFCNNPATEHHHTTEPITFNDFRYVCNDCHYKIHRGKK